ncbi:MAG: dockerin type I domain-containing protein [Rubripirellula sp.]|nr:dockerin type I domain-containing protein [Rubripirellula sp.]
MTRRRRPSKSLKRKSRILRSERLEARQLMAGDLSLHNEALPSDVNGDGNVSPVDALAVVNYLTRAHSAEGEFLGSIPTSNKQVDVDNNGAVTAKDALMVINDLRAEGEIIPARTGRPGDLDFTLFPKAADVDAVGDALLDIDVLTNFKTLDPANPTFEYASRFNLQHRLGLDPSDLTKPSANEINSADVQALLDRASAATTSDDAIIAVVDRNGTILGVRVESGVSSNLTGVGKEKALAFAIDGAIAKARTAAFFSNTAAPLTSRTIRSLSQTTITQRVVESSPVATTQEFVGPGLVAPIGVGGKFPPEVNFTPQVDLFGIEHQSRDSQRHAGPDQIKGNTDDFYLRTRFNSDPAQITANAEQFSQTWPESYGIQTDQFYDSMTRGVATIPGGIPLFKLVTDSAGNSIPSLPTSQQINLVGGIGVFFPGEDGYASHEQGFEHQSERAAAGLGVQSEKERTNAEKVLEAEFAALVAAAGTGSLFNPAQSAFRRDLSRFNDNLPPAPRFVLPTGRIDLVGITLEIFGPNPDRSFRKPGIDRLLHVGDQKFGGRGFISGDLQPINAAGDLLQDGQPVPEGWLVAPKDSAMGGLTAEAVDQIVANGVIEAQRTRAAIRLDIDNGFKPGARTSMVLAVADTDGELLGAYRMPDATIFSIDVAIAKARNTAYYADPDDLQDPDRLDFNNDGVFGPVATSRSDLSGDTVPLGTALTNRTFRFVVEPRYPSGIELNPATADGLLNDPNLDLCDQKPVLCLDVAPQSILRMPGINPLTAENLVDDQPLRAEVYGSAANTFSVLAFDAFNPSRNFRDPGDASVVIHGDGALEPLANQNGIVFFPGSTPLYLNDDPNALVGGFGVSGDGVDQDDVVTVAGQDGFAPPQEIRVDSYIVAGVRLPFQKFNRSPFTP